MAAAHLDTQFPTSAGTKMDAVIFLPTLVGNCVSRSAAAISLWMATLRHEAWQNTMKFQPVVEFLFHEADEVGRGVGGFVFQHQYDKVAFGRGQSYLGKVVGCIFGGSGRFFLFPELFIFWDRSQI